MKGFKKMAISLVLSIALVFSIASFAACGDNDSDSDAVPALLPQSVYHNAAMVVTRLQSGIITSGSTQHLALFEDETFMLTTAANTYVAGSDNFDVAGYPFNPYGNNYRQIFGVYDVVEDSARSAKIKLTEVTRVIFTERATNIIVGDTATAEGAEADEYWRRAIIDPETTINLNKTTGEMDNITVTIRDLNEAADWAPSPFGAVLPLGTFQATSLITKDLNQGTWRTEYKNQRLTLFDGGEYMLTETIAVYSADRATAQTIGYNFPLESISNRTIFGKYTATVDMPEIDLLAILLDSSDRIVISDSKGSATVGDTVNADATLKASLMAQVKISSTEPVELDTKNTRIGSGGGGKIIPINP